MSVPSKKMHLLREAKAELERRMRSGKLPGAHRVGIGYKYVGGKRTEEVAVVLSVVRKVADAELIKFGSSPIPREMGSVKTDVKEQAVPEVGARALATLPQSLTAKRRPCPGGFSCGHGLITAGTLGAWVKRGEDENTRVILSNNHVLANSNEAVVGEWIRQPGRYDGGTDADKVARLEAFATINMNGEDKGKKKEAVAKAWWWFWRKVPNFCAKMVRCPYRLALTKSASGLPQPDPNLVDAAVAREWGGDVVDERVHDPGGDGGILPLGFRDLELGDAVWKSGRTTELTFGRVDEVEATSLVSYGSGKVAEFADQYVIRGEGGEFSAGGDSGSVIFAGEFIGGLLFAGNDEVTIANRISNVVSLLGVRI